MDAVSEKATLDLRFDAVVSELEMHAVIIDEIPNSLLESRNGAIRKLLDTEGRQAVEQSIDSSTYQAITALAASGGSGADLLARIRNGIADLRDGGYEPDLLVVSSTDGAALDLFDTAGGGYVFPVRDSGQASPLFGLRIVESAAAATQSPVLIDSSRIGQLWLGSIQMAANPFTGFSRNTTSLRFETSALMVVRDAGAAITLDES